MNKLKFIPAKDYDANRLTSGILQLPDRVHLVLDEMALQPGQLDVNGQYMLWMSSGVVFDDAHYDADKFFCHNNG